MGSEANRKAPPGSRNRAASLPRDPGRRTGSARPDPRSQRRTSRRTAAARARPRGGRPPAALRCRSGSGTGRRALPAPSSARGSCTARRCRPAGSGRPAEAKGWLASGSRSMMASRRWPSPTLPIAREPGRCMIGSPVRQIVPHPIEYAAVDRTGRNRADDTAHIAMERGNSRFMTGEARRGCEVGKAGARGHLRSARACGATLSTRGRSP